MPTYQYACTECGHRLEAVQSFSDASLTVCPECAGRLRKVFSSVGIVFKGPGFYRTDSRAGNGDGKPAEPAKAESGASSSEKSTTPEKSTSSEKATPSSKPAESKPSSNGGSAAGKPASTAA